MQTKWYLSIVVIMLFAVGCRRQPIDNLSPEDARVYITNRDDNANFSTYKTFSIADSVLVIDGGSATTQLNATDVAFIEAFRQQMIQRQYTPVDKSQNPDVGLQVSRIIRTSTGLVSYPDYWGYWDPFYWGMPGAGWGFPSFWGVGTYQIREGMLSVDMVDLKHVASNNNQIKLIWNGIIRGSGIFDASTASSQVAQLFEQSPYLRTNQ